MIFYVCKQCGYKHAFLPLTCAKCKGTSFYPLVTSVAEDMIRTDNSDVIANACKKITDLENKLANVSYQLEGREIELKKLQEENKKAKEIMGTIVSICKSCVPLEALKLNEQFIIKAETFLKE